MDLRIDISFFSHRKTLRLQRLVGKAGIYDLLQVWKLAAEHDPATGQMQDWEAEDIEAAVAWNGEPGAFVAALVAVGFLDPLDGGGFVPHDWQHWQAYLAKTPERKEKASRNAIKRWHKDASDTKPTSEHDATSMQVACKRYAPSLPFPSLSLPSHIIPSILAGEDTESAPKPKQPRHSALESQAEEIYQAYPRKAGRAAALKAIAKAIQAGQDPSALLATVQAFAKATKGADPQFIPHPATWFNQGRWEDDPAEWARMGRSLPPAASKLAAGQVFHQTTHPVQLGPGTDGYEDILL